MTSPSNVSATFSSNGNDSGAPTFRSPSTADGNHDAHLVGVGDRAPHALHGREQPSLEPDRQVVDGRELLVRSWVLLQVSFELVERPRPQPPVGGEPLVDLGERLGAEPVEPALGVGRGRRRGRPRAARGGAWTPPAGSGAAARRGRRPGARRPAGGRGCPAGSVRRGRRRSRVSICLYRLYVCQGMEYGSADMTEPVTPSEGWGVLHLFCKAAPLADAEADRRRGEGGDRGGRPPGRPRRRSSATRPTSAFLAIGPDLWRLRRLQTDLQQAGLDIVDSYVSLTELSRVRRRACPRSSSRPASSRCCRPRA